MPGLFSSSSASTSIATTGKDMKDGLKQRLKASPTTAASYLSSIASRSGVSSSSSSSAQRSRSSSVSASLVSYRTYSNDASSLTSLDSSSRPYLSGSPPPSSSLNPDDDGNDDDDARRDASWRGLATPMPLPSSVTATRPPNRSYDIDFTPNPEDPYSLKHSEYGYDVDLAHRTTSRHQLGASLAASEEEPSIWIFFSTYLSYALLICIGHLRDFFDRYMFPASHAHLLPYNGYAPLYSDFDSFYTRRLKLRLDDCFSRPVTHVAARTCNLLDRTSIDCNNTFTFTGEVTQALNVSSYNYLGFAQSRGACADEAEGVASEYGRSSAGGRGDVGTSELHLQSERLVAHFLGVEDCMIVAQGFATNSTTLPALLTKGCLVISDELNHSSIRFGARLSGAMVRQYKHNDMEDLENLLRECVSQGQPRTHRPWKKILLVAEGLYSMEGTIVNLPRILELKDAYKFYLYLDEAHSVGALGPRGRGVCDYFGIDPRRIDILMGTFTKSFGAAGGYIAGSHALISALRLASHAENYAEAMSPPVVSQIMTSTASIMGPEAVKFVPSLRTLRADLIDGVEGQDRLRRLAFNCRYFSGGLKKLGFIVFGHRDSPIVPMLLYNPGKMGPFSRLMLERHRIVVVIVAYPATPLVSSRVRFCLSAAHTKADLDRLLIAVDDVGTLLGLKLSPHGKRMRVEDVIREGVDMVRRSELE